MRPAAVSTFSLVLLVLATLSGCSAPPPLEPKAQAKRVSALVGGRVQPSPDAAPIADGVVIVEDGRIAAVGRSSEVPVPAGALPIDCTGGTVTAGFWNSHVHLMGSAL